MGEKATRDHIVEAADRLFYQQGYENTSFSDIAASVQISRGNFYYHFKTKDEILDAVIKLRLAERRMAVEQWDVDSDDPVERIKSFIHILTRNRADIQNYGCPVGTMSTELAKLNHAAQAGANSIFTLYRTWLARQFAQLGCAADADELAMHLLARSQGVAVLANAFHDERFIQHEVAQMCDWVTARAAEATAAA